MKHSRFLITFSLIQLLLINKIYSQICLKTFDPVNCKYSIISEVSMGWPPIIHKSREYQSTFDFGMRLGLTKNISKRFGVGLYAFSNIVMQAKRNRNTNRLTVKEAYIMTGIRPRLSYYIQNKHKQYEIDFAPGIIFHDTTNGVKKYPGYSLEAGFSWKNHFGFFTRVDFRNKVIRRDEIHFEKETVFKIGVKIGGKAGGITNGVFGLMGIIGLLKM